MTLTVQAAIEGAMSEREDPTEIEKDGSERGGG